MRVEHQRLATSTPTDNSDDIWPARGGIVAFDLDVVIPEPSGDEVRNLAFARAAGDQIGVGRVDGNKVRGEVGDLGPGYRVCHTTTPAVRKNSGVRHDQSIEPVQCRRGLGQAEVEDLADEGAVTGAIVVRFCPGR